MLDSSLSLGDVESPRKELPRETGWPWWPWSKSPLGWLQGCQGGALPGGSYTTETWWTLCHSHHVFSMLNGMMSWCPSWPNNGWSCDSWLVGVPNLLTWTLWDYNDYSIYNGSENRNQTPMVYHLFPSKKNIDGIPHFQTPPDLRRFPWAPKISSVFPFGHWT